MSRKKLFTRKQKLAIALFVILVWMTGLWLHSAMMRTHSPARLVLLALSVIVSLVAVGAIGGYFLFRPISPRIEDECDPMDTALEYRTLDDSVSGFEAIPHDRRNRWHETNNDLADEVSRRASIATG